MSGVVRVPRVNRLRGVVEAPSDKAISIRALLFATLAHGASQLSNVLVGENTLDTVSCLRALGVQVDWKEGTGDVMVGGLDGVLEEPTAPLNVGTSMATMRGLAGILAGNPFLSVLTGTHRTNHRLIEQLVTPLRKMGADVDGRAGGSFGPLVIRGGRLKGIEWELPVASAERLSEKSALVEVRFPCPDRRPEIK